MKRYFIRMVKYLLLLLVLYFVTYAVMFLTKTTSLQPSQFGELFLSEKGMLLIVIFIVLSIVHPFIGYVKRQLSFEATQRPEKVIEVIEANGFTKIAQADNLVRFKADSGMKKLQMLYEDEITLNTTDGTLEGSRKEVTRLVFRIQSQMMNH